MAKRLISLVISIGFFSVYEIYKLVLQILKYDIPSTFVILTYHSVSEDLASKFENQIAYLKNVRTSVLAGEIPENTKNSHFVAVTFDDGYVNFLTVALPILKKFNVLSTIFITAGNLGSTPGWIKSKYNSNALEKILSKEEIIKIPDNLVEIGAHSMTHPYLSTLKTNEVYIELKKSKDILENITGKSIKYLSFPFGSFDDRVVMVSKSIGYKKLFLNIPNSLFYKTDRYLVGRISMSMSDWKIEYRLKILGAYFWLHYAIKIKRYIKNKIFSFMI